MIDENDFSLSSRLVSENKVLCHPSSVDSISTSAGQEDHVSMGGWSARKALKVIDNVETGRISFILLLSILTRFDWFSSPCHWVINGLSSSRSLTTIDKHQTLTSCTWLCSTIHSVRRWKSFNCIFQWFPYLFLEHGIKIALWLMISRKQHGWLNPMRYVHQFSWVLIQWTRWNYLDLEYCWTWYDEILSLVSIIECMKFRSSSSHSEKKKVSACLFLFILSPTLNKNKKAVEHEKMYHHRFPIQYAHLPDAFFFFSLIPSRHVFG